MVRSGRGRPPAHLKQLQRKSSNSIGSGGRSGGAEQRRQTHRASLYGAEGEDAGASSGELVGDEAGEVTMAPLWMRGRDGCLVFGVGDQSSGARLLREAVYVSVFQSQGNRGR
jgi:hypothetical protein